MTAMADMMFQLLIFFMLSANIASFSLLDLRTGGLRGGGGAGSEAAAEGAGTATGIAQTAIWTLADDGRITSGGQRFDADRLDALADALLTQGTPHVLIVVRPEVGVQRVVTVLQALSVRGIRSVQIVGAG